MAEKGAAANRATATVQKKTKKVIVHPLQVFCSPMIRAFNDSVLKEIKMKMNQSFGSAVIDEGF
jgi:hypothetical protein